MVTVRTVGIEEELLLMDPATGSISSRARQVIKEFREHGRGGRASVATDELDQEIFRHQLEVRTDPTIDLADAEAQVRDARRSAGEAAEAAGLTVVACGNAPRGTTGMRVSRDDRYQDMVDTFGEVTAYAGTCGMHVHVGVGSDEEGVGVIDRIAPWLPVLLAISANSPFDHARDTGYASWRSQLWQRWPSAGATAAFGSLEGYRAAARFLVDSGAARDPGMLYFDARLAVDHPTVEIRVSDVCTDSAIALLVASLGRGLVETAARQWADGGPLPGWRAEALRACHWRAARHGVADALVHPARRDVRPAREVLDALVEHVRPALADAGDLDRVDEGLGLVLAHGGASQQRAAYERTDGDDKVGGVVADLVARTRASWDR